MYDKISEIMTQSSGPKNLIEDTFKVADLFAKETGQEFLLKKFREIANQDVIKLMAERAYAKGMMELLTTMKDSIKESR